MRNHTSAQYQKPCYKLPKRISLAPCNNDSLMQGFPDRTHAAIRNYFSNFLLSLFKLKKSFLNNHESNLFLDLQNFN